MAANMYRVGGMYVNVDLFLSLSNRNPLFPLCVPLVGRFVWLYFISLAFIQLPMLSYTSRDALSQSRKVRISKYLWLKMGQASPQQQLAASSANVANISSQCKHFFLYLSPPFSCSLVFGWLHKGGIRRADNLAAPHGHTCVFKRLLKCYHGQSETAFVFASSGMQPLVRVLI